MSDQHKTKCHETGKIGFTSATEARKSLAGQMKSQRMRPYFCDHCHYFHNTKEKKTRLKTTRFPKEKRYSKHKLWEMV